MYVCALFSDRIDYVMCLPPTIAAAGLKDAPDSFIRLSTHAPCYWCYTIIYARVRVALLRRYIGTLLQHGAATEPNQVSHIKPSLKLVVTVFPRLRIVPLVGCDSANNQRG